MSSIYDLWRKLVSTFASSTENFPISSAFFLSSGKRHKDLGGFPVVPSSSSGVNEPVVLTITFSPCFCMQRLNAF